MGLWLLRTAPVWGRDDDVLDAVTRAFTAAIADPAWRELIEVEREEAVVGIGLHPAEERVRFDLDGDRLRVAARTNSAGPGYHAYVADLLDQVADDLGFAWDLPEDLESYVATRDFDALQAEACAWLRTVAGGVTEHVREGVTSIAVSLSPGFNLVDEPRIASPLGLWEPAWFAEVATLPDHALPARARAFFPWFDRALDASVWVRAGLAIAWMDVPWRAPRDAEDEASYRRALSCLTRARAMDAKADVPAAVEADLRRLLDSRGQAMTAPAVDGVGFRRRVQRWPLAGGWTMDLPGYYTSRVEREGQTEVMWFPGRTVRVSTITARDERGRPAPAHELLKIAAATEGEALTFTRAHLHGQAALLSEEEDGARFFTLQGGVAAPGELCVVTISFSDPADREWAVATWSSAFHPGPAAPEA